jgi:predicted NUDIX family phosphoesterase
MTEVLYTLIIKRPGPLGPIVVTPALTKAGIAIVQSAIEEALSASSKRILVEVESQSGATIHIPHTVLKETIIIVEQVKTDPDDHYNGERVLVTKQEPSQDGFMSVGSDSISESELTFIPRFQAELDPMYRQLINYAVVRFQDRVLVYQRSKKSGEGRLVGKYAVGVGGHINDTDFGIGVQQFGAHNMPDNWKMIALLRELKEELGILPKDIDLIEYEGLLCDSESSVSKVHLGLVFTVNLKNIDNLEFENSMHDPKFIPVSQLQELATGAGNEFEKWSSILALSDEFTNLLTADNM